MRNRFVSSFFVAAVGSLLGLVALMIPHWTKVCLDLPGISDDLLDKLDDRYSSLLSENELCFYVGVFASVVTIGESHFDNIANQVDSVDLRLYLMAATLFLTVVITWFGLLLMAPVLKCDGSGERGSDGDRIATGGLLLRVSAIIIVCGTAWYISQEGLALREPRLYGWRTYVRAMHWDTANAIFPLDGLDLILKAVRVDLDYSTYLTFASCLLVCSSAVLTLPCFEGALNNRKTTI